MWKGADLRPTPDPSSDAPPAPGKQFALVAAAGLGAGVALYPVAVLFGQVLDVFLLVALFVSLAAVEGAESRQYEAGEPAWLRWVPFAPSDRWRWSNPLLTRHSHHRHTAASRSRATRS